MTKTLYDPEVEKRGIEIGIQQGIQQGAFNAKLEVAKNLLDVLDDETIALKIDLDIEVVKKLRLENMN